MVGNLNPRYKTIANFRKDNIEALKVINKDFILLCRQLKLFKGDEVAVDGSFFKADASKDSIYTEKQLEQQLHPRTKHTRSAKIQGLLCPIIKKKQKNNDICLK